MIGESRMWKNLYKRMAIQELEGEGLPKPSEKSLARFEKARKIKLPTSYREYGKLFGVGELVGYYRIAFPLDVESDYSLEKYDKTAHGEPEEGLWAMYASDEVMGKMLFFGETIGGEMFAWNISEINDASQSEYSVYMFKKSGKLEQVAKSFSEFVQGYCLPNAEKENLPFSFLSY